MPFPFAVKSAPDHLDRGVVQQGDQGYQGAEIYMVKSPDDWKNAYLRDPMVPMRVIVSQLHRKPGACSFDHDRWQGPNSPASCLTRPA